MRLIKLMIVILITFSYGRGLQASALKEFGKNQDNIENIQKLLIIELK